jgi:hypothetical protein
MLSHSADSGDVGNDRDDVLSIPVIGGSELRPALAGHFTLAPFAGGVPICEA